MATKLFKVLGKTKEKEAQWRVGKEVKRVMESAMGAAGGTVPEWGDFDNWPEEKPSEEDEAAEEAK